MILDIHVHHVPEAFVRFVEKATPYAMRLEAPRGESVTLNAGSLSFGLNRTFFDAERLIARMAEMRVDRAVLSLATPFVKYDVPATLGRETAELYNNEIAALCKRAPERFEGWAYLPMQDPEAAAIELRRAVTALGLVGGYVSSNVKGQYLDSAEFSPIFQAATELGVPLFVHPSNPPARERMANYELAVVAGYLFDTTLNIFNMIFGGLFDRHPTLRLCCTHLGGYTPMLHARMQRELDTNPVLAASLTRPLVDYLRAIYFDTICFDPFYARSVIDSHVVDPTHLVLGSDTPFPLGEPHPVGFIERSFGSHAPDLADAVLHRNASAFLKCGRQNLPPEPLCHLMQA
jgi:aminocarboxymuconate-semialdehyde decarboxylase